MARPVMRAFMLHHIPFSHGRQEQGRKDDTGNVHHSISPYTSQCYVVVAVCAARLPAWMPVVVADVAYTVIPANSGWTVG